MYVYTYVEWLLAIISKSGIFEKQEIFTIFRMIFFRTIIYIQRKIK